MDNQDRIQNNEAVSPTQVLPKGYQLDDYIIENEIGSGGFGITYKAFDQQLNRYVAIKEYFPFNLAARDHAMHVSPKTRVLEDVDEYSWGLSRFIQEARTLALFEHASIIRVIRFTSFISFTSFMTLKSFRSCIGCITFINLICVNWPIGNTRHTPSSKNRIFQY